MASIVVNLFSVLEQFYNVGRIVLLKKHKRSHKVKNYLYRYSKLNSLPVYLSTNYCLGANELAAIQATMSTEETASEAEEAYAYQDEYDIVRVNPEFSPCSETVFSCFTLQEIKPGVCFIICGKIKRTCERFSINLVIGNSQKDIALHFNPRIPQNYIVRNCRINSAWGKEEVTSPLHFNLHRNDAFTVQIAVMETDFYLAVNGKHFAAFRHRLPYGKIKGIEVKGDVSDIQVDQIHVDKYPELSDREVLTIACSNTCKMPEKLGTLLPMPCYGRLTENFTHGKRLHIKGRIKILPHSFFLNLQQGSYIWPHPQIAFHFNARFGNVGGRHLICSNSWLNGKWDKELRSECCHFMPGKEFYLVVACEESSYQIFLNDVLIQEYHHRCEPRIIDTMYIQGDIQLQNVFMENTYAYN